MKRFSILPLMVTLLVSSLMLMSCENEPFDSCPEATEGHYDIDVYNNTNTRVLYRFGSDVLSIGDQNLIGGGIFENSREGLYLNVLDESDENLVVFELSSIYEISNLSVMYVNDIGEEIEPIIKYNRLEDKLYLFDTDVDDLQGRMFLIITLTCE